jgi:CubicO group peptidase (beta-lactamase class C family)
MRLSTISPITANTLTVVALMVCLPVYAEIAQVNPARHSGGIAAERNNRVFQPSANPLPLPVKEGLSYHERWISDQANQLVDRNKTTALLLVERGQIVFEKYKAPATPASPLFSQSMSKSVTAYTIGNMLCAGLIQTLDAPLKTYVPAMAGTAQGEAPLRHVLSMSSGAVDAINAGAHEPDEWNRLRTGKITTEELIFRHGKKDIESGQELRYNAKDTFALSWLADDIGGFHGNFERFFWGPARTESKGYWLHDRKGRTMSASGLSVTARDWARLAIYSIVQTRSKGCIGEFMRSATTAQVPNKSKRIGQAFESYGYQTWIGGFKGKPSYWWVGYGGQRVGVDPETERVLVLTSWREDYMSEVYKLWSDWNR